MKKLILTVTLMLLAMHTTPIWAQEEKAKGASAQAYEHADENAIFNRIPDWFATIGKSKEEKDKILAERKAKRAAKKAEKEAEKAKKELRNKADDARKGMEKAGEKAGHAMDNAGKKMGGKKE